MNCTITEGTPLDVLVIYVGNNATYRPWMLWTVMKCIIVRYIRTMFPPSDSTVYEKSNVTLFTAMAIDSGNAFGGERDYFIIGTASLHSSIHTWVSICLDLPVCQMCCSRSSSSTCRLTLLT